MILVGPNCVPRWARFTRRLPPRGAGPDVELSAVVDSFSGSCPCDFVIRDRPRGQGCGFCQVRLNTWRSPVRRSNRGNAGKVYLIRDFYRDHDRIIRIVFLADGPGLAHRDTWKEACELDCIWDDNVRVTTLKLANDRLAMR